MIIAVASFKGGVGKSTIVCSLAAEYAKRKKKILLIDTDKIATTKNWADYREEHEGLPDIEFLALKPDDSLLRVLKRRELDNDAIFVDMPGHDAPENRAILMLADIVIYPFSVSQTDLDTLPTLQKMNQTLEILSTKNPRFFYLINQAPTNTKREVKEARAWIEGLGIDPMETVIHGRQIYRTAMAEGRGVTEMNDEKAKSEVLSLLAEIMPPEITSKKAKAKSTSKSDSLAI